MPATPLLQVRGLSKTFPGVRALDRVSLTVAAGEIVAIVGQNGSGKSTLVKALAGIHAPDPGSQIRLSAGWAQKSEDHAAGPDLHFIHQELGLISSLSTIENLGLTGRVGKAWFLPAPRKTERRRAEQLIARFGASFDVTAAVADLTPAERTIVAIARAFGRFTHPQNLFVLDEPTAALGADDVAKLFRAVRNVASEGAGVIFISHRLDEVMELADVVLVLRDGRVVADVSTGDCDHDELVALMVGSGTSGGTERTDHDRAGPAVLSVRGLCGSTVTDVSLEIAAGEIVGVAGVLGSGREELLGLLFGARPGMARELSIAGRRLTQPNPMLAIECGLGYVSADRMRDGLAASLNARENLTLPWLEPLRRPLWRLDLRAERRESEHWLQAVNVRPLDPERQVTLFSGGNQQKVAVARWLRTGSKILLLDEPTQGVDVGGKAAIYDALLAAARAGTAILLSSTETKELTGLCDRVLVMRAGRVVAVLEGARLTEARIVQETLGSDG